MHWYSQPSVARPLRSMKPGRQVNLQVLASQRGVAWANSHLLSQVPQSSTVVCCLAAVLGYAVAVLKRHGAAQDLAGGGLALGSVGEGALVVAGAAVVGVGLLDEAFVCAIAVVVGRCTSWPPITVQRRVRSRRALLRFGWPSTPLRSCSDVCLGALVERRSRGRLLVVNHDARSAGYLQSVSN